MTVEELISKLEDFGNHLEVKIRLDENMKYGQYDIQDAESGRNDDDGVVIVELVPV